MSLEFIIGLSIIIVLWVPSNILCVRFLEKMKGLFGERKILKKIYFYLSFTPFSSLLIILSLIAALIYVWVEYFKEKSRGLGINF